MTIRHDTLLGKHFAKLLTGLTRLQGEEKEMFFHLIESLINSLSDGHSCLVVSDDQKEIALKSGLVGSAKVTPLVLLDNFLYLQKYYLYEDRLASQIVSFAGQSDQETRCDDIFFNDSCQLREGSDNWQRLAVELAVKKALCLISGGPGTGKTTTVVRILGVLLHTQGIDSSIALAAPTGKAAMRLRQSVNNAIKSMSFPEEIKKAIPGEAATLHRLLGVRKHSTQFIHNHQNPLNYDVVVVDEASMVDLALMSKLVDALKPGAKLILLGDKDQLTSVESGAVLSDLISSLPENRVVLQKSYRFEEGIKTLAEAVNNGESAKAWTLLTSHDHPSIGILETESLAYIHSHYSHYFKTVNELDREEYKEAFLLFNRFQVLCATRTGNLGADAINTYIDSSFSTQDGPGGWYCGRPVIMNRNDYSLGLFNGDLGICLPDTEVEGRLKIWFEDEEGKLKSYLPYRLPIHQTAFAITVHKSQGSEFEEVLLVLPDVDSPVLSRELVYTAITRAKKNVRVHSTRDIFSLALSRKSRRKSGLSELLEKKLERV